MCTGTLVRYEQTARLSCTGTLVHYEQTARLSERGDAASVGPSCTINTAQADKMKMAGTASEHRCTSSHLSF